jgi:hypothetical protein
VEVVRNVMTMRVLIGNVTRGVDHDSVMHVPLDLDLFRPKSESGCLALWTQAERLMKPR